MWWRRRKSPNRLERVLAASALEDAMARAEASREPRRAYTTSGKLVHLLGPDGHALCPLLRSTPATRWIEYGSDKGREATMAPCLACEQAAGQAAAS